MGTIPAPNIVQDAAEISRNPLAEDARAVQLGQEQQQFQQEEQQRQIQTQMLQQQLQDQKAMTAAMQQWDGKDFNELPELMRKNGISGPGYLNAQQQVLARKTQLATLDKDQLANLAAHHDAALSVLDSAKQVPDDQLSQHISDSVQRLQAAGHLTPDEANAVLQHSQSMTPDQFRPWLDVYEKGLIGEKALVDEYKTKQEGEAAAALVPQRQAEAKAARYKEANGMLYDVSGAQPVPAIGQNTTPDQWNALIDDVTAGNHALNLRTKAQVGFYLKQGNIKAAQDSLTKAGEEQGSIEKETNPQVVATKTRLAYTEANARQQAAQGDPAVAGKMLADGSLTLADLKTRGTTPQFIEQATAAAQKLNPSYNPADEIIAEHLAKSPQANQFFGSANSLIAKGGTLDQLAELGKKIPQHDFPVLNSIDDWQKLARGKGPLAAYAATALGVADDYGKVMGGGNASDHARDSALELFAKAASPEQRADAIAATRNAVQSQRDHRIGNNQFMKRAYQVETGSDNGGAGFSVKAPNGKTYNFPDQNSLDTFKKAAGIQ